MLVNKKNGQTRLCVDFQALNKITRRDNFPLPIIEQQIDQLKSKAVFSKLDLKDGFHHIRIDPECTKYTSFVTSFGQFEYLRLPFGLINSPSVFSRYISTIFSKLIFENKLLVYMDDLLVATETYEENIAILKEVFELRSANLLQLKLDKCEFLKSTIIYLGYSISIDGIPPNPKNLKAVENFPVPKTPKELHSFVGLVGYFRKFIHQFSVIDKPLYDLLKKDTVFKLTDVELQVFDRLKSILLAAPVLAIYSHTAKTELLCDASSLGYGSCLLQEQKDGKFHPIVFFSKRITVAESRYHSFEWKCSRLYTR